MASESNGRLIGWMRQQLTVARPAGEVVRFELRHVPMGSKTGHEVATIEPSSRINEDWYEATASQIFSAAENDAQGLGAAAPQSYVVLSFREKNPQKADARFTLPRQIAEEQGEFGFESEPANPRGMLSQLMRHNEALTRNLTLATGSIVQAQQRTINRLSEQNEKLQEQKVSLFEMTEELMSKKQDREIEMMQAESRNKVIQQMAPDAKLLVGAIVNKLAGSNVATSSVPDREMLERWLATLTDEQKQTIFGALRPEQQTGLALIIQGTQKEN